ncbi:hypothetical protein C2S51_034195 [Perilla frutescens var. frutescens]|nr:hypothetical protein C2S51_034195 [Perilla frutescens var. frutescens]
MSSGCNSANGHKYNVDTHQKMVQFIKQLSLGNIRSSWMQHINDELLSREEAISQELPRSDGYCLVRHFRCRLSRDSGRAPPLCGKGFCANTMGISDKKEKGK